MSGTLLILACRACGHTIPLDCIPTASPACQECGNYGTTDIHEAIVVGARVEAAEVYSWTPYIDPQRLYRSLLSEVMSDYARPPASSPGQETRL